MDNLNEIIKKTIADNMSYYKGLILDQINTGLGAKNQRFYYQTQSWNQDKTNKEVQDEMLDSHWLDFFVYDEETGILIIYFQPIATYGKPPIVLGLQGGPIKPSFVKALQEGIYSTYHGYDNSPGAFYKEYIEQDRVFYSKKDNTIKRVSNPTRVVDAVNLETLLLNKKKIDKDPQIPARFKEVLNVPGKKFLHQISEEYIKKQVGRYVIDTLEEKIGKELSKKAVKRAIINKIVPTKIMNSIRGQQKAINVLSQHVREKGVKSFSRTNRGIMTANARRAAGSEMITEGELLAAGVEAAPETMGISLAIAGAIGVTAKMLKNQQTIGIAKKAMGTEGLSVYEVLAFKKMLNKEIAKHVKFVGLKEIKKIGKYSKVKDTGNFNIQGVKAKSELAREAWNKDFTQRYYSPTNNYSHKSHTHAVKATQRAVNKRNTPKK